MHIGQGLLGAALLTGCLFLSGCAGHEEFASGLTTSALPSELKPSEAPAALARAQFARGDIGLAERNYRRAVEDNPRDARSWLGLAACYDRMARFDLAERAYAQVVKLTGRTAEVENNLGYHFLLKGDLRQARVHLAAAAQRDPSDPQIQGNLALLDARRAGSAAKPE